LVENLSEKSLKEDLSNATTFNPPLFSLVNIFNKLEFLIFYSCVKVVPAAVVVVGATAMPGQARGRMLSSSPRPTSGRRSSTAKR
jgi:hypothetical protein